MNLIEQVGVETAAFHAATDEDTLPGAVTPAGYRSYLTRMYGFVLSVELSILNTPRIERHLDIRRFKKRELLRRDLMTLGMTSRQLASIPLCSVPLFGTPEEALGWAYPIERSTLRPGAMFRHFASAIPGEVAFASSYLKCYLGLIGEMWRSFGHALESFEDNQVRTVLVIDSARSAFRSYRSWRVMHDQRRSTDSPPSTRHASSSPTASRSERPARS